MPAPLIRRLYHAAHLSETFGIGFSYAVRAQSPGETPGRFPTSVEPVGVGRFVVF